MADSSKYRFTAGQWQTSAGGCGCGGAKAQARTLPGVNNDLILVWTQPTVQAVTGALYTYMVQPHIGILDLAPEDHAVFKNDPRFRQAVASELSALFGMRLRND